MISDKTRTAIISVVTAVWAINFLAGLSVPDYEPDQAINGIFMAIVGGLFALGAREKQQPPATPPAPQEKATEPAEPPEVGNG